MDRPITTLFMLVSVDGKISTGANDSLDFDADFPKIDGLKEGVHRYYEIEQTTDLWTINSGRVQEKMGVNEAPMPEKTPVSYVIIDNRHLNENGVRYFCARAKQFVLVTSNRRHPAYEVDADNCNIIFQEQLDLEALLSQLKSNFGCERLTIQTGGTLNGMFLRKKLFDYVDVVMAPVLVGGRDTSTLVDGQSLTHPNQLGQLGVLELINCEVLPNSYLRLQYKVIGS